MAIGEYANTIRPKGFLTVTYQRKPDEPPKPTVDDPMQQIRRLGELHDAGLITSEEFETKKAELISRI